ncbi:unnamed protein product [Diamesa hyperborea]
MLRKVPLIVILGSTGTGKTKLSVELAKRFNAEIISADSMQVYKGLNIATAKATLNEQAQAPHHLLDVITPHEPFTVTHFRDMALPIVDNLLKRSKIPIIVGGTNYYIESIVWHNLVSPKPTTTGRELTNSPDIDDERFNAFEEEIKEFITNPTTSMDTMDTAQLYAYLKAIDPISANRLHPNNKRKIIRALEVFKDYGRRLSEVIEEQRQMPGGSNLGGPSRYPNVLIFWLQCEQEILNHRLDRRVDSMVKDGLLREIRAFYDDYCGDGSVAVDYTEGILQTIGFKEFIPYLEKFGANQDQLINEFVTSPDTILEPEGWKVLVECLDELKLVTKRYSRRQIKWIKNRFLGSEVRQVPDLYALDTTDVASWDVNVYMPAQQTVESFINETSIQLIPEKRIQRLAVGMAEDTNNYCDICERIFIGEFQWKLHLKSNKHKHRKAGKRKLEKSSGSDTGKRPK